MGQMGMQPTSNGYELIQVDDCDTDEVPGSALADANLTTTEPLLPTLRQLLRLRLLDGTADHTKAVAGIAIRWAEPDAERRPTLLGETAPTAATAHAAPARCRPRRVGHCTSRIISIPILTPLPNISVHVIQPPSIGLLAAYWMSCSDADIFIRVLTVASVMA